MNPYQQTNFPEKPELGLPIKAGIYDPSLIIKSSSYEINTQITHRILNEFFEFSKKIKGKLAQKAHVPYAQSFNTKDKRIFSNDPNDLVEKEILNLKGISYSSCQLLFERLHKKLNLLNSLITKKEARQLIENEMALLLSTAGPICLMKEKTSCLLSIGPSGAGKTTFLLKIGELYAAKFKKKVALIAWGFDKESDKDFYKSIEQKWNIPCRLATLQQPLPSLLNFYINYDLMLIDTPDFSQSTAEEIRAFALNTQGLENLQVQIVLKAEMKTEEALKKIQLLETFSPQAIVVTKLDEARYWGALLDLIVKGKLPLSYLLNYDSREIHLSIADPEKLSKEILKRSRC